MPIISTQFCVVMSLRNAAQKWTKVYNCGKLQIKALINSIQQISKPLLDYTVLQKKFPRVNFQYSVSFSPVQYEYENPLFPTRLDFPKFFDKVQKINKIGCL